MKESVPVQPDADPDVARIHANYAQGAPWSVRARFELYNFGKPNIDLDEVAIEGAYKLVGIDSDARILDIGTSDGNLPDLMRLAYGHNGEIIGIDPNPNQFMDRRKYREMLFSSHDWNLLGGAALKSTGVDFNRIARLDSSGASRPNLPERDIRLWPGFAQKLEGIDDASVDAAFVMNVLYHLTSEHRLQAFGELLRVLKPEGAAIFGTSSADNKPRHREGEHDIADHLGISPPPAMNIGFTTERMMTEVLHHFKHLYLYDYRAQMHIDRSYRAIAYLWSQRSMRNQYTPIPTPEMFEEAMDAKVASAIRRDMNNKGVFLDHIHRSVAIASQRELELTVGSGWRQVA